MATQSPPINLPVLEKTRTQLSEIIIGHFKWAQFHSWKLLALPLLLLIALPILALFTHSDPITFVENFKQPEVFQAFSLSLFTSLTTTGITIGLGTPLAFLLARRKSKVTRFLDTLIDLPTVLPPSVAGVALLLAFGRRGMLGGWLETLGISLPFTLMAVILAQTFVAAPLFIKAATIGFSGIDYELKQAAALDGANQQQIFRYIILPLSLPSLISGSVMTWARALGEFGATIIFAGNFPGRTQTMPLAIYIGFEINLDIAITLAIILVCFSFSTLIIVKSILHRQVIENE